MCCFSAHYNDLCRLSPAIMAQKMSATHSIVVPAPPPRATPCLVIALPSISLLCLFTFQNRNIPSSSPCTLLLISKRTRGAANQASQPFAPAHLLSILDELYANVTPLKNNLMDYSSFYRKRKICFRVSTIEKHGDGRKEFRYSSLLS